MKRFFVEGSAAAALAHKYIGSYVFDVRLIFAVFLLNFGVILADFGRCWLHFGVNFGSILRPWGVPGGALGPIGDILGSKGGPGELQGHILEAK